MHSEATFIQFIMSNFIRIDPQDVVVEICNGARGAFRTISTKVAWVQLNVRKLSDRQIEAWSESASVAGVLAPGEVNLLPFAKSMIPSTLIGQIRKWLDSQGVHDRKNIDGAGANPSLLTCLGASFHSDALSYSDSIFVVAWLEDDAQWDLYFPQTKDRVELRFGTTIVFDSCLPHGVVKRGQTIYNYNDFSGNDSIAGMVSFDLDVKNESVSKFMGIDFMHLDQVPCSKITQRLDSDRFIHEIDTITGEWTVMEREIQSYKRNAQP